MATFCLSLWFHSVILEPYSTLYPAFKPVPWGLWHILYGLSTPSFLHRDIPRRDKKEEVAKYQQRQSNPDQDPNLQQGCNDEDHQTRHQNLAWSYGRPPSLGRERGSWPTRFRRLAYHPWTILQRFSGLPAGVFGRYFAGVLKNLFDLLLVLVLHRCWVP